MRFRLNRTHEQEALEANERSEAKRGNSTNVVALLLGLATLVFALSDGDKDPGPTTINDKTEQTGLKLSRDDDLKPLPRKVIPKPVIDDLPSPPVTDTFVVNTSTTFGTTNTSTTRTPSTRRSTTTTTTRPARTTVTSTTVPLQPDTTTGIPTTPSSQVETTTTTEAPPPTTTTTTTSPEQRQIEQEQKAKTAVAQLLTDIGADAHPEKPVDLCYKIDVRQTRTGTIVPLYHPITIKVPHVSGTEDTFRVGWLYDNIGPLPDPIVIGKLATSEFRPASELIKYKDDPNCGLQQLSRLGAMEGYVEPRVYAESASGLVDRAGFGGAID